MKIKNPNKIKTSISDRIFLICLPIALILLLILAAFGSTLIEGYKEGSEYDIIMEELSGIQETAAEEHPELNHNYSIWQDELIRVRDNLPLNTEISIYDYVTESDWIQIIKTLYDKIYSEYISDEDFAQMIREAFPDEIEYFVFNNYFKIFDSYLTPGIFTDSYHLFTGN